MGVEDRQNSIRIDPMAEELHGCGLDDWGRRPFLRTEPANQPHAIRADFLQAQPFWSSLAGRSHINSYRYGDALLPSTDSVCPVGRTLTTQAPSASRVHPRVREAA
jgi:hypothetical protein